MHCPLAALGGLASRQFLRLFQVAVGSGLPAVVHSKEDKTEGLRFWRFLHDHMAENL